ncbi:MAG: sodium:alanine symporter family protein, partial [Bacteroidota bacterium]
MHYLNTLLEAMGNAFTGPLLVALLLITGLYFSFYLDWPQIRYFRAAFRILIGKSGTQTQQ